VMVSRCACRSVSVLPCDSMCMPRHAIDCAKIRESDHEKTGRTRIVGLESLPMFVVKHVNCPHVVAM
jgi:hypothetical protein